MAMTEHRALASVTGYFHAGSAKQNPAARLLDDARSDPMTTSDRS
jgi:hypothetical protein